MELQIKINCDNAAFEDDYRYELARILRQLSERIITEEAWPVTLRDINGDQIGQADMTTS